VLWRPTYPPGAVIESAGGVGGIPPGMAGADPPPPRRTDPPPPSPGDGDEERFGPLLLRRMVKDDGRALILYRAPGPPDRDAR
jgi:hypothetical protein